MQCDFTCGVHLCMSHDTHKWQTAPQYRRSCGFETSKTPEIRRLWSYGSLGIKISVVPRILQFCGMPRREAINPQFAVLSSLYARHLPSTKVMYHSAQSTAAPSVRGWLVSIGAASPLCEPTPRTHKVPKRPCETRYTSHYIAI